MRPACVRYTIGAGSSAERKNVRLQTKALSVAQEQLTELRLQTEQMQRIEGAISQGFEELRAEFEWGFSLIVDRMDSQIEQLSQIGGRDLIHPRRKRLLRFPRRSVT
jgi:hypothetical protein